MKFIEITHALINIHDIQTISVGQNSITSKYILFINTNPHKYEFIYDTQSLRNEDYKKLRSILLGE